jgi:iron complex outermembrane receptor protein
MDASSASPDHAVGLDPMVAEQIEVIRGPASLIYGTGNVGGIINVTDHRIPKEPLDGMIGRGEAKYGGADNERSGVAVVDVGNGLFAIHADAYKRNTDDLKIPKSAAENLVNNGYAVHTINNRLLNSAAESEGASLTFDNGYAGISFARANSFYGTVAEPTVKIDMTNDRWDFASGISNLNRLINSAKFTLSYTDYQHQEIDNGTVGTTFLNRGIEGRVEAIHTKLANLNGLFGFQFSNSRFQALGSEAFMPSTQTEKQGIYLYEELLIDRLLFNAAARADYNKVHSSGGDRFGPAREVDFVPVNLSVGSQYALNPAWKINFNLTHSERAPAATELFAHGAHLATNQYQIGNSELGKEVSNGIEAGINWKAGAHSASFNTYYNRFSNFITGFDTGYLIGTLRETQIKGVPAEFKGFEAQAKFRIYEGTGDLDWNLRGDYVRATDESTGNPLPRIAPMRIGTGIEYQFNQLHSKLDVLHGFKQDRLAIHETVTDGYTLVNATVSYQLNPFVNQSFHLEAFAKARNLLNEDIRDHSSYLKDIAPMGGRSLLIGIRGEF